MEIKNANKIMTIAIMDKGRRLFTELGASESADSPCPVVGALHLFKLFELRTMHLGHLQGSKRVDPL